MKITRSYLQKIIMESIDEVLGEESEEEDSPEVEGNVAYKIERLRGKAPISKDHMLSCLSPKSSSYKKVQATMGSEGIINSWGGYWYYTPLDQDEAKRLQRSLGGVSRGSGMIRNPDSIYEPKQGKTHKYKVKTNADVAGPCGLMSLLSMDNQDVEVVLNPKHFVEWNVNLMDCKFDSAE